VGDRTALSARDRRAGGAIVRDATVAVGGADARRRIVGSRIYLHSRHEPVDEAKRLVEHIDFDERIAFFVHGFGLGYHVEQLFDRASHEALICVCEPDLQMIRTAMECRDLSRLLESRRVLFLTKPDKSEIFVRLAQQMAMFSLGYEIDRARPERPAASGPPRAVPRVDGGMAGLLPHEHQHADDQRPADRRKHCANIGWYAATPSLARLKDKHKGEPAIIVSAGPSLRKTST
jgi:hypothetical protein